MQELYTKKYRVDIIESERGWGSKVDEQKDFNSLDEAKAFVTKFNAVNNEAVVPDWYMYAATPYEVFVKA